MCGWADDSTHEGYRELSEDDRAGQRSSRIGATHARRKGEVFMVVGGGECVGVLMSANMKCI